jgi:hypothetical protein
MGELKEGLPILPTSSSINFNEAQSFFFFKETLGIANEV